jgi:hypothetical protein
MGERTAFHPTDLADLVAFWDFAAPAGADRVSRGPRPFRLREMQGPIARVGGGVWGPYAARIEPGQWFRIERADCDELNIFGPDARVSVVAWIERADDRNWQYVAGIWPSRTRRRQYAIYTSGHMKTDHTTYERSKARHQVHGFVSDVGGPTPGKAVCCSYATGGTSIEKTTPYTVGFTYDGSEIRVYVNGALDELARHNPFPFDAGIYDGGPEGGDFTIAARDDWPGYPETKFTKSGFAGRLAGVAVYRRALSPEEMSRLHRHP